MISRTVIFCVLCCGFLVDRANSAVTNEDIRVAILQIVNVIRSTDDKLERHEYREKVLGEQLKKGLINIDKRIKMLDPVKGTVSRIDERLAHIETILMQKDKEEQEKQHQQKQIYEAILDLQKNLPNIINELNNDISNKIVLSQPPTIIPEPTVSKIDFDKMERDVVTRMDKLIKSVNKMEDELAKIRNDNINSIKDLSNRSSESLEKVKRQLDSSEQLLARYENKLAEYNNKIPEFIPSQSYKEEENGWKENFMRALDTQKSHIKEILNDVKDVQNQMYQMPTRSDVEYHQNSTLHKLSEIKDVKPQVHSSPVSLEPVERSLMEIRQETATNRQSVEKSFNDLSNIISQLTESFTNNYDNIRSELTKMSKLEQVVMQTADSVLDTKRKVEYGTHQVLAEVAKQMKDSSKMINEGLSERFDLFELTILDEESGALHNLTSKIGDEIDQVWRQIGNMHQQMTASTDTLNKLQNQTDAYVSGSLGVMDSMKGKVGQITARMGEVDENLNYLLGRLSLVTQEFNQIKSRLVGALEEIRSSFQAVEDNIKDNGPGPHKIASNEVINSN